MAWFFLSIPYHCARGSKQPIHPLKYKSLVTNGILAFKIEEPSANALYINEIQK